MGWPTRRRGHNRDHDHASSDATTAAKPVRLRAALPACGAHGRPGAGRRSAADGWLGVRCDCVCGVNGRQLDLEFQQRFERLVLLVDWATYTLSVLLVRTALSIAMCCATVKIDTQLPVHFHFHESPLHCTPIAAVHAFASHVYDTCTPVAAVQAFAISVHNIWEQSINRGWSN